MSYENTLEKVIIRLDGEEKEKDAKIAELEHSVQLKHYKLHKALRLRDSANERVAELEKFKDYYQELVEAQGYYGITDLLVADTKHKERIAELENPWISVEDRLPDVGKWYLCWSRNQAQIIFLDTAEPIIWLQDGDYLENVTHWMPLPEPPKEQGE